MSVKFKNAADIISIVDVISTDCFVSDSEYADHGFVLKYQRVDDTNVRRNVITTSTNAVLKYER
jgi:hypothetical protein